MKRETKYQIYGSIVVLCLMVAPFVVGEIRWAKLNRPEGQFSTAAEYVERGRLPSKVTKVKSGQQTAYVALGTLDDYGWALPSGPPAYVFDSKGKLIDWSGDTGDDPGFREKWSGAFEASSVEELKQLCMVNMDEPL